MPGKRAESSVQSAKAGCLLYPGSHPWREGDGSGAVTLSTFISAFHSVIWITVTTFANDEHLGGTANMWKDTVRIEHNLGRLEKWFGRKVG